MAADPFAGPLFRYTMISASFSFNRKFVLAKPVRVLSFRFVYANSEFSLGNKLT